MKISSRSRSLIAAVAAACVLAVAGCSSSDNDATSATSSATTTTTVSSSTGSAPVFDTTADTTGYTGSNTTADATEPDANTGTAAAPVDTAPAATTEVPAPTPGNINQTVAPVELTTNAPVPLSDTADYGNGVTVKLSAIESITTQAELPGEISGPGVKLTVDIANASSAAIDLGNVIVDLADATSAPAIPMTGTPAAPFSGSLAAGTTATGVYVFTVPADYANPATISVTYSTDAPVVVFTGDAK